MVRNTQKQGVDLICPIISPDNESDLRKVIRHVFHEGYGANVIFTLGTTGEFYVHTLEDKMRIIDIVAEEVSRLKEKNITNPISLTHLDKSLELAVGVTGENLTDTIELANYARDKGADYAVLMPVYYTRTKRGKFTRIGVSRNVEEVIKNTPERNNRDISFILYDHPGITNGLSIRTATWKKLARNSRIVAIKTSSTDYSRVEDYKQAAHGNARVYVGDEILGLEVISDGIVAGSSNVLPAAWSGAARRSSDPESERTKKIIAYKLQRFQKEYSKNGIGAFFYMLNKLGIISSAKVTDPSLNPSDGLKRKLDQLMRDKDFENLFGWNQRFGDQLSYQSPSH